MRNVYLSVSIKPNGNPLSALLEVLNLAKAIKENIEFKLADDLYIIVREDSNIHDLNIILELKVKQYKEQNKKS